MIHCHYCKATYNVTPGTLEEKGFIVTNVCDSSPDTQKIYFCTFDCYSTFLTLCHFVPRERDSPEEVEEKRREYLDVHLPEVSQRLLQHNTGIREWMKNELVDRIPKNEAELYEESKEKASKENFQDTDNPTDWSDF